MLDYLGFVGVIILLLLGSVLAFFGKKLLDTLAFLIGAILGAILALMMAPYINQLLGEPIELVFCIIIAVIVGALIGGYLGKRLMYGMISFFVASICSYVAYALTLNPLIALIVFFIALVIMWFMVEKFLAVITALLGGMLVGAAVMTLITILIPNPMGTLIAFVLFLIIAGVIASMGARYQLEKS